MDAVYPKPTLQSFVMPLLEEQQREYSADDDSVLCDGKNSADGADAGSVPALNWRVLCNKNEQISQVSDAPSPNATPNMTAQKKAPARQTVPRRANNKKMARPTESVPKRRASYGQQQYQLPPQPTPASQQRPGTGRSSSYYSRVIQDPKDAPERVVKTSEVALFMRCKMRYMDPNFKPIPPSPGGWEDVTPERVIAWEETTDRFSDFSPFLYLKRADSTWNHAPWLNDSATSPSRESTSNDVSTPGDKQPSNLGDKFSGHTSKIDTATPYNPRGTKPLPPMQKQASKKPPPISTALNCNDFSSNRPIHMHHQRLLSDPMLADDSRGSRQDYMRLQLKSPMSARFAESTTPRHLPALDSFRAHVDAKTPNGENHRSLFSQQPPPLAHHSIRKELDSDMGTAVPITPSSAAPFSSFSSWSNSGPTSPQDSWYRGRDRLPSVDGSFHARSASLSFSQRRSSMWALDLQSSSNPWSPTSAGLPSDDQLETKNPRRTSSTSDVSWLHSPTANSSHGWNSGVDTSSSDSGWSSIDDRFMSILKVMDEDSATDKSQLLQNQRSRGSSMVSDNGSSSNSSMVQSDGMSVLVANAQLLQNIVQTGRMGCRYCGSASHFVFRDCPFVLSKAPNDAWNSLMQAAQGYDVDVFMESLEIYSKSRPAETLQTIGHQLSSLQSVIQLVAIEKRLPDTTLVMDLQGHPSRYAVSAMALGRGDDPLQAIRRLPGFPQCMEQNMIRLAESGFPRDLTEVAKCRVCKQAGHWVKDCIMYPEYQRRAGSLSNTSSSNNSSNNSNSDLHYADPTTASKKSMEGSEPYRLYYNMNDYVVVHRA